MSPISARGILVVAATLLLGGCASTASPIPQTRTVIVFSGERLQADAERMRDVNDWLRPVMDDWERNPSFILRLDRGPDTRYPWDTIEFSGDTVAVGLRRGVQDAETPHYLYGWFRLIQERGELGQWLPGVDDTELSEFEGELVILEWVSDVWLLGRSVFDTQAYGPLDELVYAKEGELLKEFVLETQAERFAEERSAFARENPDWEERLREFFVRTFEREGPGYRADATESSPSR